MGAKALKAVVMGTSAGGLGALSSVLPALPKTFPLPVMVVIHLPADRKSIMAELLSETCALTVSEAEDKEDILPGHIYFAPPDYHLLVEANGRLSLSADEPVLFSRPSIDVLFESAADVYGEGLMAVVLTGANEDGAAGARAVAQAGGRVIVQDPQTAFASAMPEAALVAVPQAHVLMPDMIASELIRVACA
ncbi:chemotaxis protein CheB [Asticcacaulis sp. EMRT-3]|uniref:chemotaxis protein CheB n=1 Tax=Asticcacaulis sp. EMRT-3 TaxID=3040349 RepID=UPI0024AF1710|nr:chemotaxis protein CheB [Asticcacaulis sp. EMRT-3]MDI7775542.1 chemotaxis protein CheB [Asticcacaulis sp. EMRT-3]